MPTPGAYLYDVHVANAWHDSFTARLGAEAAVSAPLTVRAGLLWDAEPGIDNRHFGLLTPDSSKLGVTTGARWSHRVGKGRGRIDLDLAAMHLFFQERDIAPTAAGESGSDGTILNKPAPSFFYGVTRAGISVITLAVAWRQ